MNLPIFLKKFRDFLKLNLLLVMPLLLVIIPQNVKAISLELKPLRVNFWDAVATKNKIIVYGSLGQLLVSSDYGHTWEQQNVGDCSNIRKMININDTLWGILENCSIIKSTDFGSSWERIQLPINDTLLNFLIVDNKFVLRGVSSLYILDRNLQIISSYQNDTLKIIPSGSNYDELAVPFHSLGYSTLLRLGNKIIFPTPEYASSGFGYYDLSQKKFFFINLENIINKNDPILDFYPYDLFYINGEPILRITSNLYKVDTSLTSFKYFFKDTLFANFFDTTWVKKGNRFWRLDWNSYFVWNNKLFVMQDADSLVHDSTFYGYLWDGKRALKYLDESPTDTFETFGETFKNVYLASLPYGYDWYNPILGRYFSKPSILFDDSIFVFLLRLNFYSTRALLISDSYFKKWKLISFLKGYPIQIFNDSIYFFYWNYAQNYKSHRSEIFITYDAGETFQPLIRYNPNVDSLPNSLQGFKEVYIFQTDTNGKGFILGNCPDAGLSLIRTNDFWKTFYSPKTSYSFPSSFQSSNFVRNDSNYFFVLSETSRTYWELWYHSWFYLLDTSFINANRVRVDSFLAVQYILPYANGHILFCIVNDSVQPLRNYFEIRKTSDFGKSFDVLYRTNADWSIVQFYEHNKDSIFFTTEFPNKLYLYLPLTNELKLLWEAEEGDFRPLLMVISDRFYLVGRGLFLENTDRSDLTQWREGEWDYGKPNFESVIFRGNVAIAGLSDSLRPFNYYKITLKKQEPSVVKEPTVEKRYYTTHFWASDPYPQPAKVRVKARVAWDGSFDLREAIDGVYDTMGRKVEGKEQIRVDARSTTSGELEWECSGIPAGIYFILIRWSGGSETVTVVVE